MAQDCKNFAKILQPGIAKILLLFFAICTPLLPTFATFLQSAFPCFQLLQSSALSGRDPLGGVSEKGGLGGLGAGGGEV